MTASTNKVDIFIADNKQVVVCLSLEEIETRTENLDTGVLTILAETEEAI